MALGGDTGTSSTFPAAVGSLKEIRTCHRQALTLSNLDHWPRGPVDLRSYWPEGQ